MQEVYREVTPQEFATLVGCADLVGGYCLNVTEHSGVKATYHDRSVSEWVAFSHVLPGGDTHYFVSDQAMDRVHSLEDWRHELYEEKAA